MGLFVRFQEAGQPAGGIINSIFLSGFLERELSRTISEAPVSVKAAVIALHSCIDNLRYIVSLLIDMLLYYT